MPLRQVQVLSSGLQIYLTPAVIYFSSVLLMSALLTVPNQTRLPALICFCLEGAASLGYSGSLAIGREAGMSSFRSVHTPSWLVVAWYCCEGPKSALTW
jgi:hypothetical protein